MKKILYCILHGSVNKNRYYNIKKTWGKNEDCLFYSDYEDLEKNIVKVSNRNDYHSNEEKHINAIKYINTHSPSYEWYFFCDDDTFVNTSKLESILGDINKDGVNGCCNMDTYPKLPNLRYCSGGAGYLIHKNLLEFISNEIKVENTGYSDVTLGIFLKNKNIPIYHHKGFNSQNNTFHNVTDSELKNHFTFHYIKSEHEMNNLKNKL